MVEGADLKDLFASVELKKVMPTGSNWKDVSRAVLQSVGIETDGRSDIERFLLMSLIVGVRFPDTDGHSIMNLDTLRLVHSDPSALGTYSHCVRGPEDDYQEGDAAAVAGARMFVLELIEKARESIEGPAKERIIRQGVYLDFYGLFETEVFAPFFYVGKATHVLQDCFSHTVRSEADELRKIVHVVNYVDAISKHYDEERDGLAHSDFMDNCRESDLAPIVEAAGHSTSEFLKASADALEEGDNTAVMKVLDDWVSLKPGCDFDNDMCGNQRMLNLARRNPTQPYFQKYLGCSTLPGTEPSSVLPGLGLLLALLLIRVVRGRTVR